MAYLETTDINQWLASTKYTVSSVEDDLDASVVSIGFGRLSTRYATDDWTDKASTPDLVITALSMLYAAWFLQRQISDDEMTDQDYPIRLEKRAYQLLDGIATDIIDLPGFDPDPDLISGRAPVFFPTDSSTQLSLDDPTDPDGSPRAFSMNTRF